jgi:hypothetical protein
MTLARLQQLLVIGWLIALVTACALPWQAGHPLIAVMAAAGVLFAHALWLGVTFALMHWHNRRDPAPRASWGDWLSAWWGEVRAAPRVFGWRQPFRSQAEPDFLPAGATARTGVVLVHGFVCNRGLWTPWLKRLRAAGVPFIAVDLEPVFGSIDDYVPIIEAAVARLEQLTGERPLLVGHSMGGLAIRAWLAAQGADERVRGVLTIGTPHRGTWLANFAHLGINAREMKPGGHWLRALEAAEPPSRSRLFHCIYGHGDNIVFPASNALLPGAQGQHVPGTAHIELVHRPEVMAELWRALGIPAPA